jgi:4-amino-4-deoxy-L-arabinose transferase-like glycosyltransferase
MNNTLKSKNYTLSTILFALKSKIYKLYSINYALSIILLVLFLIRFENITIPPLDAHTQRQTLTLSIARNLKDVGFDFFHPTIDIGRSKPSHMGCEAPIFNTLIYAANQIFGTSHWYGRLINLIISTIGVWFFFAFLKRYLKETEAFSASLIFAVSLYFVYSRKTMPDTFALSLVFMGNYAAMRYLNGGKWGFIVAYGLLSCLGMLAMACGAIFLLIPFFEEINLIWRKKQNETQSENQSRSGNVSRLVAFCVVSLLSIGVMSVWYFWWIPYLSKYDHAFTLYEAFPFEEGWRQFWLNPTNVWNQFSQSHLRSWLSFSMLLPGLFFLIYRRNWLVSACLFAYFTAFAYFAISAGYVYPTHEYYGLPFTPAMSVITGFGLANLLQHRMKIIFCALFLIAFEAIRWQRPDFEVSKDQKKYENLEEIADKFSIKTDRFLVPPSLNFKTLYMLNRKGETCNWDIVKNHPDWVIDYGRYNLKYIFIEKSEYRDTLLFPIVYEDENYRVYRY